MTHTSARTDSDLLDALTVPTSRANYDRNSRAYVRIDTSIRAYWHQLFDVCPQLLELAPPDGLALFHPFMAWAADQSLSMNWTFYLWVYQWLRQSEFRDRMPSDLVLSMMGASAASWAIRDRSANAGIVLGSGRGRPLIVGWKCRRVEGTREVERVDLEEALPDPEGPFGFFTVPDFEIDRFPGWSPLPR